MADGPGTSAALLECPVCLQTFTDPVLLGECGHTFCRHCIEALSAPSRCPTCRKRFNERSILPNFALRVLLREGEPATHGVATRPSLVRSNSFRVQEDRLVNAGVPAGLARLIREEDGCIALRIFLLDNSGSTATCDGNILKQSDDGKGFVRHRCTRWEEVCNTAVEQANWNASLGTPCEFVLLNPPAVSPDLEEGFDLACVNPEKGDVESQVQALKILLQSTGPTANTPLSDRLRKIYKRISPQALDLGRNRQKVVLILVTDGLPTGARSATSHPQDKTEFVNELRTLSYDLPIHLVVRLCTDDPRVADFYNAIDNEQELDLEVIDDITSEAQEIQNVGNWFFVYSPLIHRMRESGTLLKLFDILDEREFQPMEVGVFCQLLVRHRTSDGPLPTDARQFCATVRKILPDLPLVYDPLRRQMVPPINIVVLENMILPPFDLCDIIVWLCRKVYERCRKTRHQQTVAEYPQIVPSPRVTEVLEQSVTSQQFVLVVSPRRQSNAEPNSDEVPDEGRARSPMRSDPPVLETFTS